MRSLCNVAYSMQAEHLDADELKAFDRKLEAEPGKEPKGHSRNVGALMGMMKGGEASK